MRLVPLSLGGTVNLVGGPELGYMGDPCRGLEFFLRRADVGQARRHQHKPTYCSSDWALPLLDDVFVCLCECMFRLQLARRGQRVGVLADGVVYARGKGCVLTQDRPPHTHSLSPSRASSECLESWDVCVSACLPVCESAHLGRLYGGCRLPGLRVSGMTKENEPGTLLGISVSFGGMWYLRALSRALDSSCLAVTAEALIPC